MGSSESGFPGSDMGRGLSARDAKKARVAHEFGQAAAEYDRYAFVQVETSSHLAQMCSDYFRHASDEPAEILDIGCGTGITSAEFKKHFDSSRFTLCDISCDMVRAACRKIGAAEAIVADAESFVFGGHYDLCISNLALQWFNDLDRFIAKALKICGHLAFSIPIAGSFAKYYDLFRSHGIDIELLNYFNRNNIEQIVEKRGNLECSDFKKYELVFDNILFASRYFKRLGAGGFGSCDCSKTAAILASNRDKITLNYDVLFMILRARF